MCASFRTLPGESGNTAYVGDTNSITATTAGYDASGRILKAYDAADSRRQHDTPLPQPISWGKSSHGMPVRSTKMMPVRAWRLVMGLRPGYRNRLGLGGEEAARSASPGRRPGSAWPCSCLLAQVAGVLPAARFIGTPSSRSVHSERRS